MRGLGGFNVAILEDFAEWGVSAHFVDEEFDTGDLVRVDRFPIDRERETALSLDLAQPGAAAGGVPRRGRHWRSPARSCRATPQGEGRYVTARGVRGAAPGAARRPAGADRAADQGLLVPAVRRRDDRGGRAYPDARRPSCSSRRPRPNRRRGAAPDERLRAPAGPRTPRRALLHVLRRRARAPLPLVRRAAPREARFCMSCGSALEAARRPRARGARGGRRRLRRSGAR